MNDAVAVAVDLTPAQAAELLHAELSQASEALHAGELDAAFDGYVRALGLALQLGPAPTEQALTAVLQAGRTLVQRQQAMGLSTLGPAVVDLVNQVRRAGVLPHTAVMDAWATVSADVGSLIGQVGLALVLPHDHRAGMARSARARAATLDDATGALFDLAGWLEDTLAE
jgi:hypothetical protein